MLFNIAAPNIEMVSVPAGEFRMGIDIDNPMARENPEHNVFLKEFEIGKYLVTNTQYLNFVLDTGHHAPLKDDSEKWFSDDEANHPVHGIRWIDGWCFCAWMSQKTGDPYHLPTEAQWEKAATWNPKINMRQPFPWGDEFNPEYCNVAASGIQHTTPVGKYSPQGDSPYGCADMIGNLDEWCNSIIAPYPYIIDDGRELIIAERVTGIPRRVIRGGDWYTIVAQSPFRRNAPSDWWQHLWGFRVARSSAVNDAEKEVMRKIMVDVDHNTKLYSQEIESNPKNPQDWYNRGTSLIDLVKLNIFEYKKTESDISRAIELFNSEGDSLLTVPISWFYFNRGLARCGLGQYKGAYDDISESLRLDPSDKSAYLIRIEAALALENWDQAKADINILSSKEMEQHPKVSIFQAQLLAGAGQESKGIKMLTDFLNKHLWTSLLIPEIYLYRGQIHEKQGHINASISDYYHYLLWKPEAIEAKTLIDKIETYRKQQSNRP